MCMHACVRSLARSLACVRACVHLSMPLHGATPVVGWYDGVFLRLLPLLTLAANVLRVVGVPLHFPRLPHPRSSAVYSCLLCRVDRPAGRLLSTLTDAFHERWQDQAPATSILHPVCAPPAGQCSGALRRLPSLAQRSSLWPPRVEPAVCV